ncbi:SdpI family protein [Clostridioides difficile]|nr:SdpI family protein [Clostridioides difficile]MDB0441182.1 hypothetical protein [Clostridioides difficile]
MDIFWIIDMIIPAVIILMGFLYKYRAPKDINKFHGYRTNQSMKSQEAWDYAHSYGANIWIIIGMFLVIIISLNKIFIKIRPEYLSLINLLISIAGMVIPIYIIDSKIKKFEINLKLNLNDAFLIVYCMKNSKHNCMKNSKHNFQV